MGLFGKQYERPEYIYEYKGKFVIDTTHSKERMLERNTLSEQELKHLFDKSIIYLITSKYTHGDILFFSKSLNQGYIVSYVPDYYRQYKFNDNSPHLIIRTFLPRGKNFAKPGTKTVMVERYDETIEYSNEFVSYINEIMFSKRMLIKESEEKYSYNPKTVYFNKVELTANLVNNKLWTFNREIVEID